MKRKNPKYFFDPLFIKLRKDLANLAPFRIQYASSLAIQINVYCEKAVSLKGQKREMIFFLAFSVPTGIERTFFFIWSTIYRDRARLDLWMRSSRVEMLKSQLFWVRFQHKKKVQKSKNALKKRFSSFSAYVGYTKRGYASSPTTLNAYFHQS
jgi:hypothetical protein